MKTLTGLVTTSIMTALLGLAANVALAAAPAAATPAPAASDLDVTMDVVDTTDDVAGAKEIDVGEAQEAASAGKDTAADADNVQQEVQSGAQDTTGG